MKKIIILLVLIFTLDPVFGLRINEIMYNPVGSDNNKEFIEIYSEEIINFSGFIIGDVESNDTLELIQFRNSSYSLIVEEGFDYSSLNTTIYSAGSTLGNNLDNTYDSIFFYNSSGVLLASASFNGSLANGNGFSLEWFNRSFYESFVEGGTPGYNNSYFVIKNNFTNETEINTTNTTNQTKNITGCNILINLSTDKLIYENKEKITYKFHLNNNSVPFTIQYWIEDLFGDVIKKKYNTTNTNQKSYTPSIKSNIDVFLIKGEIFTICGKSSTEQLVIIKNKGFVKEECEKCSCTTKKTSTSSGGGGGSQPIGKIDYSVDVFNEQIEFEKEFSTFFTIKNQNAPHQFTVWSYVYKGSKCYSGEREQNKQTIELKPGESKTIELKNSIITKSEEPELKFKIKVQKDEQVSTTDITKDIYLALEEKEQPEEVKELEIELLSNNEEEIIEFDFQETNNTNTTLIYQSTSSKIRGMITYFVLGLFALISAVIVWKR